MRPAFAQLYFMDMADALPIRERNAGHNVENFQVEFDSSTRGSLNRWEGYGSAVTRYRQDDPSPHRGRTNAPSGLDEVAGVIPDMGQVCYLLLHIRSYTHKTTVHSFAVLTTAIRYKINIALMSHGSADILPCHMGQIYYSVQLTSLNYLLCSLRRALQSRRIGTCTSA